MRPDLGSVSVTLTLPLQMAAWVSHDATQQARARARLTTAGTLRAGEVLSVQLHPAQALLAGSAWQVPARAVVLHQGQSWVFVAMPGGLQPTAVKVLSSNDDASVIQAPLTATSRLAVTGLAGLRALLQKDE